MAKRKRIAIGGISTECSTYSPLFQTAADFEKVQGSLLVDLVDFTFEKYEIDVHPLSYLKSIPGGAAPAQALVRLDGSSASIPIEKMLKGVCLDNETVWRDFNECNASFESLACWGHHFMGLPWER
jgi:hypothetical protein